MCKFCCIDPFPDRGRTCLETGCYILNYKGCAQCSLRSTLDSTERHAEEKEDGSEQVTFDHTCSACGHLVWTHEYSCDVGTEYQQYEMNCGLCGHGEDIATIMPYDQRKRQGNI